MTSLAKFFRFCGFGVAVTSLLLSGAAIVALITLGYSLPIILGLIAVSILFIFAVSWIVLSYGLQREGEVVDTSYQQALRELEEFRAARTQWELTHQV